MAAAAQDLTLPCEHLFLSEDRCEWWVREPGGVQLSVMSACAPYKATGNEDGALICWPSPDALVLAVADGVGGLPGGDNASSIALRTLRDALRVGIASGAGLRESILSGLERANRTVIREGNGSATTIAVVEVAAGRLRSYHVGDAGVLVFGGRGRVRLQTISHSPVGYALEAGVMDEEEALGHADRHLVSNVVGDRNMHVGMSYPIRLRPMDTVLLASDGLFDNAYTEELVERLRKGPLHEATSELFAECRARMESPVEGLPSKPDDLTLIACRPGRPA